MGHDRPVARLTMLFGAELFCNKLLGNLLSTWKRAGNHAGLLIVLTSPLRHANPYLSRAGRNISNRSEKQRLGVAKYVSYNPFL